MLLWTFIVFLKILLRTLSCLVAHENLQYLATDCSFYQTPTPTAAARSESKSGLIISIEKKKMVVCCNLLKDSRVPNLMLNGVAIDKVCNQAKKSRMLRG